MKLRNVLLVLGVLSVGLGLACARGTPLSPLNMVGPALTPFGVGLVGAALLPEGHRAHGLVMMALVLLGAGTLVPLALEKLSLGDDYPVVVLVLLFWLAPAGGALLVVGLTLRLWGWLLSRRSAMLHGQ